MARSAISQPAGLYHMAKAIYHSITGHISFNHKGRNRPGGHMRPDHLAVNPEGIGAVLVLLVEGDDDDAPIGVQGGG